MDGTTRSSLRGKAVTGAFHYINSIETVAAESPSDVAAYGVLGVGAILFLSVVCVQCTSYCHDNMAILSRIFSFGNWPLLSFRQLLASQITVFVRENSGFSTCVCFEQLQIM